MSVSIARPRRAASSPHATASLPMTPAARVAVLDEAVSVEAALRRAGSATGPVERVDPRLRRRADALRTALERAVLETDPGVAAVGRRVELLEPDGSTLTAALVLPGDGDPEHHWLSSDSPVGAAVLGHRAGEVVLVEAPAGVRPVAIVRVG